MTDLQQTALQMFRNTLAAIDIPATMRRNFAAKVRTPRRRCDNRPRFFSTASARSPSQSIGGDGLRTGELPLTSFRANGIVVTPSLAKMRLQDFVPSSPDILSE